jgi:hypothetical protein
MYKIKKKEQVRMLKEFFALSRFEGFPFLPGDIVKQVEWPDHYGLPRRGDVAIVIAVDDTIRLQGMGKNEDSEYMEIAAITGKNIDFPDIRRFWVNPKYFMKAK